MRAVCGEPNVVNTVMRTRDIYRTLMHESSQISRYLEPFAKKVAGELYNGYMSGSGPMGDTGNRMWEDYLHHIDKRDDEVTPEDNAGFSKWMMKDIEASIEQAIGVMDIQQAPNGGLLIYRSIMVPPDWVENGGITSQPLGIYWSWNQGSAEAHWGNYSDGTVEYLLTASVPVDGVDWSETLKANSHYLQAEEDEIQIKPGVSVKLLNVEGQDAIDPQALSPYIGKDYPVA